MKIIIAGAGAVGFHLAKLLASEQQEITIIDTDEDELDYAKNHLDVIAILGDSSSIEVLHNAEVSSAKMFLAVTTSEKNNLISSILAKKLGAKQTIARVDNAEYLTDRAQKQFKELGVDQLISPADSAAKEIRRLIRRGEVTDNFEFENGRINLFGITLESSSPLAGRPISNLSKENVGVNIRPVCILRDNKTMIPESTTRLFPRDHVYFLTPDKKIDLLLKSCGKDLMKIKNIMILGGTTFAKRTASLLEREYSLSIVEKDKDRCKALHEKLDNTLIIHGDPNNIELLKEEGLDRMDAVIALTPNSETNIIACLTAERLGVTKTIAQVDNTDYIHISQQIGVDTLINKKLIAANSIFRFVRKGKVEALTGLHGTDVEVIEYRIEKESKLTRKTISELNIPKDAMIAAVYRREQVLFPNDDFQLELKDKVIAVALPESIDWIDNLFR